MLWVWGWVAVDITDGHGGGGGSGSVVIWMGYEYSEWIVVDNIWNAYSWYDDDDLRKEWMGCEIYVVWGCVYELLKLLCWTRIWLTVTLFLACWWPWSRLALEGGTLSFLGTPILVSLDILILTTLPPYKKWRLLACLAGGVGKYPTFAHCCQDKRGIFKK